MYSLVFIFLHHFISINDFSFTAIVFFLIFIFFYFHFFLVFIVFINSNHTIFKKKHGI